MLNVYAAEWCPHCTQTIDYLKKNNIEFQYFEIEKQPGPVIEKIIRVNGGEDWVIPTLEFNGKWRKGKTYNEMELAFDLKALGVSI